MEQIRTFIVTITTWLSFLVALWLFFFNLVTWEVPVIMSILSVIVFGLAITPKK